MGVISSGLYLGGDLANQRTTDLRTLFGRGSREIARGLGGRPGDVSLGLLNFLVDGTILRDAKSGSFGRGQHVKWFIHG